MSIIRQDYGGIGTDIVTQQLIAPVLADMVADRAFAVGEQFIVDSVLYKATSAIAQNDPLVIGTNCELADSITQQIVSMTGGLVTESYPTTSIPDATLTKIAKATLNANHTYLITFSHDWSGSGLPSGKLTIDRIRWEDATTLAIVRNTDGLYSGGGASLSTIYKPSSTGEIHGDARQDSGTSRTVSNVSFKVYQLD